ncbi:hypothetical protein [Hydrogenophaga sp.]|uniref:hypothetical protein n=1 Tax=Hydrogenophaga sp. TaxID=1904254 RepID=UPI0025BAC5FF|nr:hypothetical protein [Hydrogenophaga sp.]MBT9462532.1 hypothetical protein [Hydrogenophaga sp.]
MTKDAHKTVKVSIVYADDSYSEEYFEIGVLAKHDRLIHQGKTGKQLIDELITDDWAAPPRKVTLTFQGATGQQMIELFYN